ncbi:hypothetical protein [Nostoc sphaeroides]|uniref:Uncharacterized protein n=1 Tax=Nostoc sphaeroides CCNUC1 TaxID=2653204 RepID=A0A5P8VUD5_9NOSO|nr:hypothetical protein [Nostoc sphaeroides]MCC5628707.1 hypothetical protein [Nostoc sphaeroides CHAB 2801]QFS44068.1 hypothetical protein GXM_01541 [Nostoc sphaeroides CCNUC1]
MRTDSSLLRSHSLNVKTFGVLTYTEITQFALRSHTFNPLQNTLQPR